MNSESGKGLVIVYDGECPICSHYVRGLRLKEAAGSLLLQDARENSDEVLALKADGHDLNREMVVKTGGRIYTGADAMHVLTLLSTPSGVFNRAVFWMFRSPAVSRPMYPLFRNMRLLLLKILRRKPIDSLAGPSG